MPEPRSALLRAAGVRDIVAMEINSHIDEGTLAAIALIEPAPSLKRGKTGSPAV